MSPEAIAAILEHAPVPTYLFDASSPDYVLVAVNALVRQEHPEIVALYGRPMAGLYADQPQALEDAHRCVRERVAVVRDTPVRRFDRIGKNQVLRLTYAFVAPHYLVIHTHDVTPPQVAEAALRESEERYRGLVTSMPDGVILRGSDGAVLTVNEAASRIFGFPSAADLIGNKEFPGPGAWLEDESGRKIERDDLPTVRAMRGEPVIGRFVSLFIPGQPRRWVRVSAVPIREAHRDAYAVLSTYTDETERVTAQRALGESSARLDLALDAARMGTWEWDPQTGIGGWSENLYRVFDIPREPDGLNAFMARVHEEDRVRVAETLTQMVTDGADGTTFESEYRMVGTDGVVRWARTGGRIFREGSNVRLAGTTMDVTERRRLEEELLRANRLESLGRLAGGVAHDFNNLLAAMLGSLEFVEDQAPAVLAEDLATARHAAERARDLTRQLLAFARRQPIQPKVLDLSRLVADVDRLLRRLVGADVELEVDRGASIHVRADASQVEQVLVNLVVNARDATPRGGRVGVRLGRERVGEAMGEIAAGTYAVIEVWDTGAGMDEITRTHAFDPFFTTKESGTGLGLASCYGIVRQHGGHIEVESTLGHGTHFRVLLPEVPAAPAPATDGPVPSAAGVGRVLVVDDEPLVRATTTRILVSLGYEVLSASSGSDAIARVTADTRPLHALVCDVMMPGRTGPEVAKDLRALRPSLKVLFVSGYPADAIDGTVEGALFLQKPYARGELAAKLRELLGR
jgi:two-component system, cell cycle sensor histidine kinase and response regulator CckA